MALPELAEQLMAIVTGAKAMPVSNAKRHHYVPQFLLRNFTSPSDTGDPKLRILDRSTGKINEVTTRGAAWERHLYAIQDEGQRDNHVEGLLSLIETHAAEALVRFLADPLSLEYGDRFTLSIYLALQETRTPAVLAERRETLRHMGTMAAALALANASGKPRHRVQEAQKALLTGRIGVEASDGMALGMMLRSMIDVGEVICGLPWVLLRAVEGEFVLSDRPLTRHDPKPPHAFSAGGWMSSDFVYTTLPLDPTHCLRISPNGQVPITVRDTRRQVGTTNLRTYGWGTRFALARSVDVLKATHEQALRDPDSVPRPVPQRIVMLEDVKTADPEQAAVNQRRGWAPHVYQQTEEGPRRLSYQVIDTVSDARAAMSPRAIKPEPDAA